MLSFLEALEDSVSKMSSSEAGQDEKDVRSESNLMDES